MLSNEEVLAALSAHTPPEELAAVLASVLRVPQAWARLHDPDFLHRASAANSKWGLPALVALELEFADSCSIPDFPPALEQEQVATWDTAVHGGQLPGTFRVVALLAAAVIHRASTSDLPSEAVAAALRNPQLWRSALACAYSCLPAPDRLIVQLLARDDVTLARLVVEVMLANLPATSAAEIIAAAASPGLLVDLVACCREERPLLHALARQGKSCPPHASSLARADDTSSPLQVACSEWFDAAPELAQQAFSLAWEQASCQLAKVADLFADFAEESADPILALEVRREALRNRPSPAHRANLAHALIAAGRPEEVNAILSAEDATPPERIALAMAHSAAGLHSIAQKQATELWQWFVATRFDDPVWADRLASVFGACGLRDCEAEVRTTLAEAQPYAPALQIACAQSLLDAGDPSSAADFAALALALDPDSSQARAILAESLQAAGRPKDALPHWNQLALSDPEFNDRLADCALHAEAWDAALKAASDRRGTPQAAPKKLALQGRALAHQGEYTQARSLLDAALEDYPHSADLWLAHAECHSLQGDDQAAGLTLATASQAVPASSQVQLANADWLGAHGRTSEAALAAQRAVALEPSASGARLHLARNLTSLGRRDEARETLQVLLDRYPRLWEARQALAMNYVASGELDAAARLVDSLPITAQPEAHFFAGSLQVQAGLSSGNSALLERGRSMLRTAERKGFVSPELYAYLARAHEKAGNWGAVQEACQHCLELLPEGEVRLREEATLGLARAAFARDLVPQAISGLKLARSRFPNSASLHTLLAQAHLAALQPNEAIAAAEAASHLDPSSSEALHVLADAADMAGDLPLARETIRRLLTIAPSYVENWLRLASVSLQAGDHPESREALAHALQLGRRETRVLREVAHILMDMGYPESALRMLQCAAAASPAEPVVLEDLGRISEHLGNHKVAERAWGNLAELQPANFEALHHAGAALWAQSKAADALACWRQAYVLDPASVPLLVALARASLATGDSHSALAYYIEATSASHDSELSLEAGRAVMTHGSPRQALEILARAVALDSGRWEPLAALGECLIQLNRPADAARALQRATRLEAPSTIFAMLTIAYLEAGSPDEAHFALDRCLSLAPHTPGDAMWVSQAAAKFGSWQAAMDTLTNSLTAEPTPETTTALALLWLRIGDAAWLYDAADAPTYKPLPAPPEPRQLPPSGETFESSPPQARLFELRHLATQGPLTDADFEEWRQLEPIDRTGESREALAIALMRQGDPAQALRILEPPEEKRYRPWSNLLTGICLERLTRYHEAYLAFQSARTDPANGSLAEYLMGRSLQAEDDLGNAAAHLSAAVTAVPSQPRWHYRLAATYQKSGKADASVPHFQRATELDSEDSQYVLALARALHETGHRSDAFEAYEKALPAFIGDPQVVTETAEAALDAGETKRAAFHFSHVLEMAPDNTRAILGAARTALSARRIRHAHQFADKALHTAPQDPAVMTVLAEILVHEGDVDQALKAYKRALRLSENPVPIHVARSALLVRAGRAPKAIEELLEATRAFPAADSLWASLASAYEACEQMDRALEAADKALSLSPSDPRAHLLVGRISRKLGQLDRALAELKIAAEQSGDAPQAALELGILLEARRDIQGALDTYRRAAAIDRRCTEAFVRAGLLLKGIKSYSAAAEMFRHASTLDPLDPTILHQLAAVRALELVHGGNLPSMVSP